MVVVEHEPLTVPVAPVTTREVLHRAADLLEEFGWCQWSQGMTSDRRPVKGDDPAAVSFCAIGAVIRARRDFGLFPHDYSAIHEAFGGVGTAAWNNAPGRTKAEVVARLRAAAESA